MVSPKAQELDEVVDQESGQRRPVRLRQKARYWRKIPTGAIGEDGKPEMTWVQTLPIPSDPSSRQIYEAKGFSLHPPGELLADIQKKEGIACPFALCKYVATGKNEAGESVDMAMQLAMHIRSHQPKKSATSEKSEQPASSSADTPPQ